MDFINAIQTLLKFVLGLLMSLLPLYALFAQDNSTKEKQIQIKYFKTEDGKQVMIDTTLTFKNYAGLLQKAKGLKVDTAALRKFNVLGFKALGADSLRKYQKIRAFSFSKNLTQAERNELIRKLNSPQNDSLIQQLLKKGALHAASLDTLHAITFRRGMPIDKLHGAINLKSIKSDSVKLYRIERLDSIKVLRPAKADNIIYRQGLNKMHGDTFLIKHAKVLIDSTGKKEVIIYRLKPSESKLHYEKPDGKKEIIIVKVRAVVEDLTEEDVKNLKKSGAAVETKPKQELELNNVSYYPNPNNGRFKLQFTPEEKGALEVRVLNSTGKQVYSEVLGSLNGAYSKEIDLTSFGKGLYFLQIVQGKRYFTKKILVQ